MNNLALRKQRTAFVPSQLQGCCIRQCLIKRQSSKQEISKKEYKPQRQRKRRLSLYSVSSANQDSQEDFSIISDMKVSNKPQNKLYRKEQKENNMDFLEKSRCSLLVIKRQKNKDSENEGVSQSVRKGLKVMLAEKLNVMPQTSKITTPFRVNVQRPSSTLDYYKRQQQPYKRQTNRPQTSLRERFGANEHSYHSILSNNSNSKRASTPSKHPNYSNQSSFVFPNNPTPRQTPSSSQALYLNSLYQNPPTLSRPQYNSNKNNNYISIPYLIEDLSEITDKRNGSEIVQDLSKTNEIILSTSRFPFEFGKKQLNQTKRPQQKIKRLEQYFKRGGYRGSGRIASVYLVQQKQLGCLFASKQVFKKTIYQKDMTLEMQREIALHYMLQYHENIITLYQVFEDYQRYYFILEFGQCNLRSLMNGVVCQDTCRKYIKDILNGLDFLHQNEIIHRHLKPQNVIMLHDRCKITDFGWAPKLLYMNNHSQIPEYCSPQVMRQQPYNHKTDIWSVGIIAYELLTGVRPFNAFTQNYTLDFQSIPISNCLKQFILRLVEPVEDKRATIKEALQLLEQ